MSSATDDTARAAPDDGLGLVVWGLDRFLRLPENAMNLLAATATLFLVFMGVYQIVVGMRDICIIGTDICVPLINQPLFGYIDLIELSMPILSIIGIAYCMRMGTHIRMDILVGRFSGRLLWSVETFVALVTMLFAIMMAIFSYDFFFNAYDLGDSTTDAQLDTWPSKLLVPIAFVMLALRLLVQFLGALRLTANPDLTPIGVVVQKDIAEQAQDEIREAMAGAD